MIIDKTTFHAVKYQEGVIFILSLQSEITGPYIHEILELSAEHTTNLFNIYKEVLK